MMKSTSSVAATGHIRVAGETHGSSIFETIVSVVAAAQERIRQAAATRRLREQLASMDDAMLLDIGIAEDEIYLVRQGARFTPRAWADRTYGGRALIG
jgi:uncharacterized protein YjiS (DUF1127 family)